MRCASGRKARRPSRTAFGGDPEGAGEGRRGEGVGDVVRGRRVDVRDLGQLLGVLLPVLDEGAVHQDAVHDAELGGAGGAEGEADRPAALLDVGLAHQVLGGRVGDVVDAGDRVALVDPALVGGVRLHGAVPVEVVGGEVEHGAGVGAQRGRPVQLVAGELDGEDVVRAPRRGPRRARRRRCCRRRRCAGRPRVRIDGEHLDGGGLAVGAGDRQPGRPASGARAAARRVRRRPRPARRPRRRPRRAGWSAASRAR